MEGGNALNFVNNNPEVDRLQILSEVAVGMYHFMTIHAREILSERAIRYGLPPLSTRGPG